MNLGKLMQNGRFLVITYIFLFTGISLSIKWSQTKGSYSYNFTNVIFLMEFVKLSISSSIFFFRKKSEGNNLETSFKLLTKVTRTRLLLMVPSFIYAVYNNLMFINLAALSPALYKICVNSRILYTGILTHFFLKRQMTRKQAYSVGLLFFGVVVAQFGTNTEDHSGNSENGFWSSAGALFLVLFQALLSSLGSITMEYFMKRDEGEEIDALNTWIYIHSIIANAVISLIRGQGIPSPTSMAKDLNFSALVVLIFLCLGGITTGYFIRYISSMAKTYASTIEMVIVSILSWILFNSNLSPWFFLSFALIGLSTTIYNRESTLKKPYSFQKNSEGFGAKLKSDTSEKESN